MGAEDGREVRGWERSVRVEVSNTCRWVHKRTRICMSCLANQNSPQKFTISQEGGYSFLALTWSPAFFSVPGVQLYSSRMLNRRRSSLLWFSVLVLMGMVKRSWLPSIMKRHAWVDPFGHSSFGCKAEAQSPPPGAPLQTDRTCFLAAPPKALVTADVGRWRSFARCALHVSPEHPMFAQVLGRGRLSSHLGFGNLSSCLLHKPDLLKRESLLAVTDDDECVCSSPPSPPLPSQLTGAWSCLRFLPVKQEFLSVT